MKYNKYDKLIGIIPILTNAINNLSDNDFIFSSIQSKIEINNVIPNITHKPIIIKTDNNILIPIILFFNLRRPKDSNP